MSSEKVREEVDLKYARISQREKNNLDFIIRLYSGMADITGERVDIQAVRVIALQSYLIGRREEKGSQETATLQSMLKLMAAEMSARSDRYVALTRRNRSVNVIQ